MEWETYVYSTLLLTSLIFVIFIYKKSNYFQCDQRLPPGPSGWPVFGHLFSLGTAPHKTIAALAPKYGPVVMLKLGSINTMAVLTAKAASELLKNHDLSFADRNLVETMNSHGYPEASMALAPYGPRWRELRRICTVEMFTNKKINETASIRQRCVNNMLSWIEKERNDGDRVGAGVLVGRYAFLASFNMLGNLMMSRDLVGPESERGDEFFDTMKRIMEWSGTPNVSDLFPWMRWVDVQGLRRKADRDMGMAIQFVSAFVKERVEEREKSGGEELKEKDFLDVLLKEKELSGKLSQKDIVIFILEMFFAGSETTSSSIEWAMTELLRNPETMAKVKDEISSLVVPNKKFEEQDLNNLPYLHAVIKETLRLHPPIPFLIPRRAVGDTYFMGYYIPKNTQVFVNAWAIGRGPECWDDPHSFKPDRFLSSNVDYKGQHFELIPFGAGRRMCPGLPLGHRMLHLVLGSLLYEFDWELESSVSPGTINMSDRMGVTVGKFEPLRAVPRK